MDVVLSLFDALIGGTLKSDINIKEELYFTNFYLREISKGISQKTKAFWGLLDKHFLYREIDK